MKKLIPFIALAMLVCFIYLRWNMSRIKYSEVEICRAPVSDVASAGRECLTKIKVEIADTADKQKQGLSGREKLDENSGMLFLMGLPDKYSFWMNQMNFPLDIIWLSQGKVVDLTENVPFPRGYAASAAVSPKELVDTVLEVNAGFIKAHRIQVGDEVEIGS